MRTINLVAIVDVEHPDGPKVVARVATVREAEEWVARQEKVDPEKVHRGGYGIDGPERGD